MNVNFVLVDERYEKDFKDMIPKELQGVISDGTGIILGCINEEAGEAYGVIVVTPEDLNFRIDWIYVDEDVRRLGIASRLVEHIKDMIAIESPESQLIAEFSASNTLFAMFCQSMSAGMKVHSAGLYEAKLSDMDKLLKLDKDITDCVPFERIDAEQFVNQLDSEYMEFIEGLDFTLFDKELSHAILKYGKVSAFITVRCDEDIWVEFLYGKNAKLEWPVMIAKALTAVKDRFKYEDKAVKIIMADTDVIEMVRKMIPNLIEEYAITATFNMDEEAQMAAEARATIL